MLAPAITVRPTRAPDAAAIAAMVGRCSPSSLRRRFLGPMPPERASRWLQASVTDAGLSSWLAEVDDVVVAIATTAVLGPGEVELALLVEDAWQRQGIGAALVGAVASAGRAAGARWLRATAFVERLPIITALAAPLGGRVRAEVASGGADVAIALGSHPCR